MSTDTLGIVDIVHLMIRARSLALGARAYA